MESPAIRLAVAVCLMLGVTISCRKEVPTQTRVLSADISFHVACTTESVRLAAQIEVFLRQNGFRALNLARIQKEHGVELSDLHVLGIDHGARLVQFVSLDYAPGRFAVTLNTEPPTRRDATLEHALISFATQVLGCDMRQTTRGENTIDAVDLFRAEVSRVQGLFQQAAEVAQK